MKKIYLFQHFIGGEIVEQLASFDKKLLLDHAYKVERESPTEKGDDPDADDVWCHQPEGNDADVVLYAYDQYIRAEGYDDEDEILIREIDFLDWKTSPITEDHD